MAKIDQQQRVNIAQPSNDDAGIDLSKKGRLPQHAGIFVPTLITSTTDLSGHLTTKKSLIHGLGLFANRDYSPHDVVWVEVYTLARPESDGPLRWTNHSDDPNCRLLLGSEVGNLEVGLIALRNICAGEEITYNYGDFGHTGHRVGCNCGSRSCCGSFVLRNEWGERK